MIARLKFCVYFFNVLLFVRGAYPPQGDEVQMGSVLLPATRRGRYLANIVRRQAVDGTGIKFNKDADRMNADAKKKVDVLSEELLPYIIAEQERRTTLYKRVMTAIQNGEKGVTIAEIRNKPPLIIRKGLMYRCPANRAPKEPNGSGVVMCETDVEPTPIMYDSCLSAEDKDLYVADTRYFFCNRHKIEGPDLPRNGSTVIGCAPLERTSLNYTSGKCALEDTDDVVVHYRYYPDKTYKFVTELDPDHEVCDHWNPCQIGYIYSLPSPDQAMPANELWRDYEEKPEEYENYHGCSLKLYDYLRDNYRGKVVNMNVNMVHVTAPKYREIIPQPYHEIVPPIPEDNPDEFVPDEATADYQTSPRKIEIPDGHKFHGIGRFSLQNIRTRVTHFDKVLKNYTNIKVTIEPLPEARRRQEDATTEAPAEPSAEASVPASFITIQLFFTPIHPEDLTHYYARFESETQPGSYKYRTITILHRATIEMKLQVVYLLPGQVMNITRIPMKCGKCTLRSLMVRAFDGGISNLERAKFKVRSETENEGRERKFIEIEIGKTKFTDFGDYFVVIQTEDGNEERLKALSVRNSSGSNIVCHHKTQSVDVGSHIDNTVKYECEGCVCEEVLCEGESMLSLGRISVVTASKFINFNFPSFENENACVYIGIFKDAAGKLYRRTLQAIDNASLNCEKNQVTTLPAEGAQFEYEIPYQCMGECGIEKVTLNGVPLETVTRRQAAQAGVAFFMFTPTALTIRITSFSFFYCGFYQALFNTASGPVTKTVLEIKCPDDQGEATDDDAASSSSDANDSTTSDDITTDVTDSIDNVSSDSGDVSTTEDDEASSSDVDSASTPDGDSTPITEATDAAADSQ